MMTSNVFRSTMDTDQYSVFAFKSSDDQYWGAPIGFYLIESSYEISYDFTVWEDRYERDLSFVSDLDRIYSC